MRVRTKKQAQAVHAKRRLRERYGLKLNRWDLQQLVQTIQKGRAVFVRKQSNRVSEWLVPFNEQHLRCLYDKERKSIITALPRDCESTWTNTDQTSGFRA